MEKSEDKFNEFRNNISKDLEERELNLRKIHELSEKNQFLVIENEK
jgi:hypothetical protein